MPNYLGAIGNIGAGFFQGQDELLRRQMMQAQLQDEMQKRQGLAKLAEQYGTMRQMQQDQAAQVPPAPMPGQPSMPQQPQQAQPQPQMQGMGMPGAGPQLPPPRFNVSGDPGAFRQQLERIPNPAERQRAISAFEQKFGGAPGVKPYTEPQAPQPQMQSPQIPQMPAQAAVQGLIESKLPSLQEMSSTLQKQGITGMPLYYALMQHQNFLSSEGKQQLAQLTEQVKMLSAQASMRRADTGQQAETRREATAAGETPMAKAKLEQTHAQTEAIKARANKAAQSDKAVSDEDVQAMAEAVSDYRLDPKSLSTKGGFREKVLGKTLQINPAYDYKNYSAEAAGQTSASRAAGTAGAQTAIAGAAAMGGQDILREVAAKVPRGQWRFMNQAILSGENTTGDPNVGAFVAALNTFVNEYARAVNPKGTATVSDKEHAREILSTSDSPDQFEAKMSVLRKEMERSRQAPKDVAEDLKAQRLGSKAGKTVKWSDL